MGTAAENRQRLERESAPPVAIAQTLNGKWRDRRVEARESARRALERARRRELRRAAHASRADALARGLPRYQGSPCRYHPACTTKYASTGRCIECAREDADQRRIRNGTFGRRGRRIPRAPRAGQHHVSFVVIRPMTVNGG